MLPVCSKGTTAVSAVLLPAMMVLHKHTACEKNVLYDANAEHCLQCLLTYIYMATKPFCDVMQSTDSHAC